MKNLLQLSDSDEEVEGKRKFKDKKQDNVALESSDDEGDEDKKKNKELRKLQKKEVIQKKKDEVEEKRKKMFFGESYGHYKIGSFLRIEIKVDKKFSRLLSPQFPIILSSLLHTESQSSLTYIRLKIKKHRWYPHILKTFDPITFSMGFRKF